MVGAPRSVRRVGQAEGDGVGLGEADGDGLGDAAGATHWAGDSPCMEWPWFWRAMQLTYPPWLSFGPPTFEDRAACDTMEPWLGDAVGAAAGLADGDALGEETGDGDGLVDGDGLGDVLGEADGLALGDGDGLVDGEALGDADGCAWFGVVNALWPGVAG